MAVLWNSCSRGQFSCKVSPTAVAAAPAAELLPFSERERVWSEDASTEREGWGGTESGAAADVCTTKLTLLRIECSRRRRQRLSAARIFLEPEGLRTCSRRQPTTHLQIFTRVRPRGCDRKRGNR